MRPIFKDLPTCGPTKAATGILPEGKQGDAHAILRFLFFSVAIYRSHTETIKRGIAKNSNHNLQIAKTA